MNKLLSSWIYDIQKNNYSLWCLFGILLASLLLHLVCMSSAALLVEETYYWNYSQHLDFSYLDHPPMVALLIKLFTSLLGTYEFSVRIASLFCWLITAFFSYQLTELIDRSAGQYTLLLLAVLPFYFFQSIIITPDVPLITCWSATLYYLYRTLVLNEASCWYKAGVALGLGMLSKYTICLLGLGAVIYVAFTPNARFWFKRKEPYIGGIISLLLFSPVIYWNATHQWASFIFQSSRRFASVSSIDTHNLIWTIALFITPLGVVGLWELIKKDPQKPDTPSKIKQFFRYFTFIPLGFFILYSLNHEVNFNWTGPLFLALLPCIAQSMTHCAKRKARWLATSIFLLSTYSGLFLIISLNQSEFIQQKLLIKIIAWDDLVKKLDDVAAETSKNHNKKVVFVPLDNYPISSELSFYQQKLYKEGIIKRVYPIMGAHLFNRESLMYRYWSSDTDLSHALLILVTKEPWRFEDIEVTSRVKDLSQLSEVFSVGQGRHIKNIPYYYKVVQLKRAS